ncbi:MAG: DUF1552 domain-containing protein [Polyangiaceae bacterium]|nr:DUF1552 domain-containing protein [Polyangiaceae bacterium]
MGHRPDHLVRSRGRRRFLMGGAGALALPFLESLTHPKPSFAWTPQAGMPRRLVTFFHGHGLIMEELVPGPNMSLGAILQPIADVGLVSKSLVLTGLNMKTEGGHAGTPSLFTCTPLVADQYGITHGTTPSVEHVIAQHMQDGGLARRLDLGVSMDSTNPDSNGLSQESQQVFWSGDNEQIESVIKPELAFDRVFPNGPPDGTEPRPSVDYLALRRRSVLDGVLEDFNRLQGRVSAADRARLEAHAARIREVEQSLEGGGTGPVPLACADGLDVPLTGLDHRGVAETQIDILAYAIACNVFDVGTFQVHDLEENAWGHVSHPNLAETFAGENYHGAWHRASDGQIGTARAAFTAINAWYGALFARLLQKLDQIDEGEGTALDNTMVLWACDFGHGGGHSSDNFAVVMAGNAGGATLGRHVNYASDPTSPYGDDSQPGNHNLAVTMTNAFGITGDTFGDYNTVIEPVEPGPLAL